MGHGPFVIRRCVMTCGAVTVPAAGVCVNIIRQRCLPKTTTRPVHAAQARRCDGRHARAHHRGRRWTLHGSVGPSRTTITRRCRRALASSARPSIAHFATEEDLFAACSGHFAEMHPRPDASAWGDDRRPGASGSPGALDELVRRSTRDRGEVDHLFEAVPPARLATPFRCGRSARRGSANSATARRSPPGRCRSPPRRRTRSSSFWAACCSDRRRAVRDLRRTPARLTTLRASPRGRAAASGRRRRRRRRRPAPRPRTGRWPRRPRGRGRRARRRCRAGCRR